MSKRSKRKARDAARGDGWTRGGSTPMAVLSPLAERFRAPKAESWPTLGPGASDGLREFVASVVSGLQTLSGVRGVPPSPVFGLHLGRDFARAAMPAIEEGARAGLWTWEWDSAERVTLTCVWLPPLGTAAHAADDGDEVEVAIW